jgi:hypothetical protein
MSQVVYTVIQSITDLPAAKWHNGSNDSYTATQRAAEQLSGNILLVGRLDKLGRVDLVCARDGSRDEFNNLGWAGWVNVNASHVHLARYFAGKYETDGPGQPFASGIDDPLAVKALRSLVALDCGTNGSADEIAKSVRSIGQGLDALGVCFGDWRYVPMIAEVSA